MKKIYTLFIVSFFSLSVFAVGHVATAVTTNVTCNGACDGTASAMAAAGVGPYGFTWAGPGAFSASGANITGLCAGSYTVTAIDSADMSIATYVATVFQPAPVTITPYSPTICTGMCTTLSPTVSGGTAPYAFSWTPGSTLSSSVVAFPVSCPFTTTTYTLMVTDANGCVQSAAMTVLVNPMPVVTVPPSYSVCMGSCVTMTALSSLPGSTYSWVGAAGFSSSVASPVVCPTASGSYIVTATSAGGCASTSTTSVIVDSPIIPNISSVNTSGCGICDGTALAAPTGGTGSYTYMWAPAGSTAATSTGLCVGNYSVTITDALGCSVVGSTTVYSANPVEANFTMVPDSTDPYVFYGFNASTGADYYIWDFGGAASGSTTVPNPTTLFGSPGVYNVCLVAYNSICGMGDTLCQAVTVTGVLASCNALFNIADDTLNPDPNAHYIYNLSYGATLSYLWDFGDGTTSTSMTPSHVYSGTGPYLLCLTVDNGAGCTDMFCDSLISADSLNRSAGTMQFTVYEVPPFQGLVTGIADQANLNSISVSPNPFNDVTKFEIKSNKTEIYSFELTDVLGKKVKSMNGISAKQFEISRSGLQNGIYFYKIYTSETLVGIGKVVIK